MAKPVAVKLLVELEEGTEEGAMEEAGSLEEGGCRGEIVEGRTTLRERCRKEECVCVSEKVVTTGKRV